LPVLVLFTKYSSCLLLPALHVTVIGLIYLLLVFSISVARGITSVVMVLVLAYILGCLEECNKCSLVHLIVWVEKSN